MYLRWILRVTGAALLAVSAAMHLDLYLTGFRTIPTIGPLFLVQVIAGFGLALAIVAAPLIPVIRRPAVDAALAAAGAGCAIATLGGYLLSLWVGLFGFHEIRSTAGTVAGIAEIGAFGALLALAVLLADPRWFTARERLGRSRYLGQHARPGRPEGPGRPGRPARPARPRRPARLRAAAAASVAGLTAVAAVVFGASVATAKSGQAAPAAAGGSTLLRSAMIGGVPVLTNASGHTLYWFAPDTPSHSACSGECAAYWPPVTGSPSVGPGVALRQVATIRRADGSLQVTYDGHPLYTYIGDTAPGQASGNDINLNGGLWHEVPARG